MKDTCGTGPYYVARCLWAMSTAANSHVRLQAGEGGEGGEATAHMASCSPVPFQLPLSPVAEAHRCFTPSIVAELRDVFTHEETDLETDEKVIRFSLG